VEPDDVGDLAAALLEAIDDPAERARRGARGHAVAVERYGWPALAQRLADVLDAAVAGAPAPRPPAPLSSEDGDAPGDRGPFASRQMPDIRLR
jgi:hypothetical protein